MIEASPIAIVGTGLLGGSIGLGLRAVGYAGTIIGVGRRQSTLDKAMAHGCVDEVSLDIGEAARRAQLVILATPLGHFEPLLEQVAASDHEGLVVTDVGSTKAKVMADARRLLPDARRFVGSHPMAGSERHGPEHAEADLFDHRPCIVVAEEDTDGGAVEIVSELWATLGMRVLRMTAEEHDRKAAAISHVPHALAVLLVELAEEAEALDVASSGFADTTRIAASDPDVWADIFMHNPGSVVDAIDKFAQRLQRFRDVVAAGDRERVKDVLSRAKQVRDGWASGQL